MKQETPNSDEVAIPPCLVRPGPRDVNGDEKKVGHTDSRFHLDQVNSKASQISPLETNDS